MYLIFIYLLLLFFDNSKSLEASITQNKVHFPPVTYYYTNILLNLLNGTDHSIEFVKNEVNKIFQHSDRCEELFEVLLSEQHLDTWKNYDDKLLSKLLLSMIEVINKYPENINIDQIRLNTASNSSKSVDEVVKTLEKNTKTCEKLFVEWFTFPNMNLKYIYSSLLFPNFFLSMRVLKEK